MGQKKDNWLTKVRFELFLWVISIIMVILSFYPQVVGIYVSLWLWYMSPIISTIIIWRCIAKVLRLGKVKPVGRLFEYLFFFMLFLATYTLAFIIDGYEIRIMAWVFVISIVTAGYSGWLHYIEGFYDEKNWWKPKNRNITPLKPIRGISLQDRIRRFGSITLVGIVLVITGIITSITAFYILFTNNESVRWSDILAIGLAFISMGIALISLGISRNSDRKLTGFTQTDFDTFIDYFENQRLSFLDEFRRRRKIDQFMVEVFVWKSRVYFERAISLKNWVDKTKINKLAEYFRILVDIVIVQSGKKEYDWSKLVRNREVNNIVSMYLNLWRSGIIDQIDDKIKNDLIAMFEYYIGHSKTDEDYIDCFKRILEEISSKESRKTFKIIKLKKEG